MFCVPLGAPGPLRAPSGGAPGPNDQTKVTATLRPVLGRVLRLRAVAQWSTRLQITTEICAECLRRDRRVFTNPRKTQGFLAFWHPLGSKTAVKLWFLCFLRAAASPKKAPRRGGAAPRRANAQNPRKWRSDLGCVFVVLFFLFCVFCKGALSLCLALFWRPLSSPRVSWGPLWGPLCAARGAQRGPPYRRDSFFLGSLWGPLGCSVGSCTLSSVSFGPFP